MLTSDFLTLKNIELIIKASHSTIAVFDEEMNYLLVSDQWIKDFKIEHAEIIGRCHYDIFPEILDMPEWLDLHKRALSGEIIKCDGEVWERSYGKEFVRYEIHPWLKPNGSIGGIIMCGYLETLLKNLENDLRESNEICRRVMKNSPIGIALLGTDGRWMDVNDALCNFLGYEKEELLQTNFQTITHPDDLDTDIKNVESLISGERNSYLLEKRYLTKAGNIVWALLSATLLRDEDKKPAFFLSQLVDITALKEADMLRENFISLVSHELRTPLTSVMLSLDSLERYKPHLKDDLFDRFLEIAQRNSHRLYSLIGDIIDAERLQAKSFSYTPKETRVADVIEQSIAMNLSMAEAYKVNIDSEIDKDLPDIHIDPQRLIQVITNFLTNATRFSPQGKPVLLKAKQEGSAVIISVKDHGVGIPREFYDSIFKKFMREDNDINRKQGGTGLGLYISKQIVETMGGEIGFESKSNEGTIFWCRFPV
jgi:PAS domain S-box-containing protein